MASTPVSRMIASQVGDARTAAEVVAELVKEHGLNIAVSAPEVKQEPVALGRGNVRFMLRKLTAGFAAQGQNETAELLTAMEDGLVEGIMNNDYVQEVNGVSITTKHSSEWDAVRQAVDYLFSGTWFADIEYTGENGERKVLVNQSDLDATESGFNAWKWAVRTKKNIPGEAKLRMALTGGWSEEYAWVKTTL